ncbi:cupin domain-containing protein [Elioraea sp.]|uniref:cupin domain-containing protein n=1 Tax=Elioraea sp. TaxID=2185103 RepID=UPI00307D2BA1
MTRALPITAIEERSTTSYLEPFRDRVAGRHYRRLADAFGLTQFGVNLVRLAPGAMSALRHAHSAEDEFVLVLHGTPTLVTNDAEETLSPGLCVGFPCNTGDAHHLVNRSTADVVFLVVGTRAPDRDSVDYPDVDLRIEPGPDGSRRFTHKDGTPY